MKLKKQTKYPLLSSIYDKMQIQPVQVDGTKLVLDINIKNNYIKIRDLNGNILNNISNYITVMFCNYPVNASTAKLIGDCIRGYCVSYASEYLEK